MSNYLHDILNYANYNKLSYIFIHSLKLIQQNFKARLCQIEQLNVMATACYYIYGAVWYNNFR